MKRDRGYLPLYAKLLGYPQTGSGGNETHGYYDHFSVGEFQMGGSRFRMPPQVGEVLDYDEQDPPQRGPRVGDMCVTQIVVSGVRGVSGVDTSVTGTYMSYVHAAAHTCS
jgi:hypothetical protein